MYSKVIQIYIYIIYHILFHYGLLWDIEYSSLCYTVGPCCLSGGLYLLILFTHFVQPPTFLPSDKHTIVLIYESVSVLFAFFYF